MIIFVGADEMKNVLADLFHHLHDLRPFEHVNELLQLNLTAVDQFVGNTGTFNNIEVIEHPPECQFYV
jgi:hypothetical protein